jgi:hypothetical protein
VLCAVIIPTAYLRSLGLYYYTVCGRMCVSFVRVWRRNSNGTKHSGGPPEDGREKGPKHIGVLYLQTRF